MPNVSVVAVDFNLKNYFKSYLFFIITRISYHPFIQSIYCIFIFVFSSGGYFKLLTFNLPKIQT